MHGSLVHMSYENKSDQSRQAYTLHIVEGPPHATYPADNWFQATSFQFLPLHPQPIGVLVCSDPRLLRAGCSDPPPTRPGASEPLWPVWPLPASAGHQLHQLPTAPTTK